MKYWIYKGKRLVGGIEVTRKVAGFLESKGYRLVPTSGRHS